jgi:hypothetical protein
MLFNLKYCIICMKRRSLGITLEPGKSISDDEILSLLVKSSNSIDRFNAALASYLNGSLSAPHFLNTLNDELLSEPNRLVKGSQEGFPCKALSVVMHRMVINCD